MYWLFIYASRYFLIDHYYKTLDRIYLYLCKWQNLLNFFRSALVFLSVVALKGWWKVCQALGCIGAVAVFVGWLCLMCWLCQKRKSKSTKTVITGSIFTASKALCLSKTNP